MPANVAFVRAIETAFPSHEIEIIELADILKGCYRLKSANVFVAAATYGMQALRTRTPLGKFYRRTRFFFDSVHRRLSDRIAKGNFDFSIQIQSLFDGHCPQVPHFVYTDHTHYANLSYAHFDRRKLIRQWLPLERTIYRNASLVFSRSSNISRSLIEDYEVPEEKVSCIYAGPNVERPRQEYGEPRYDSKRIVFVGFDWQRKGGPTLISAFERVRETHPDATLTIIGAKPTIEVPNCEVVGPLPLAKVGDYYRNSAVFCLPTLAEPFGIVLTEALSYSLPVVATNVGAIPDIVTDGRNGYLVEPGDVEGLANKLSELLSDPDKCRQFGRAGYRLSMDRYDWGQVGIRLRESIQRFGLSVEHGPCPSDASSKLDRTSVNLKR